MGAVPGDHVDDPAASVAGGAPAGAVQTLVDLLDPARAALAADLDRTALTDGRARLTWREYVSSVDSIAAELLVNGVVGGDRVVVRMLKSVWSFVSVHAVLRAGGVVVPIDPLASAEHAARVATDAGATIALCDTRSAVGLAESTSFTVLLDPAAVAGDVGRATGDDTSTQPRLPRVSPTDPAYIIYTSGSTGTPKGIVHTHASALAYARTAASEYGLDEADRLVNIAPLQFDQSTFELYAAPFAGASVVVVPDAMLRFPASLTKLIADEQATVLYTVPFVLDQMVTRGALGERDLSSVRWVLFGGEAYAPERLDALRAAIPGATISNVYGPAEVNQCTRHDVVPGESLDREVPIGTAWSAADLRLVDADDPAATLDGAGVGRLLVASPTAMAGYWERPDLTVAAFRHLDGRRWYDTGDLVRRREDGRLVFVGRVDNQVKVRGQRIELEAVDAALGDVPGVDAAISVVRRGAPGSGEPDELIALVVAGDGRPGSAETADPTDAPDIVDAVDGGQLASAVRASLALRLPTAMVPDSVLTVDDLPRTASGKIDRTASSRLVDGS